MPPQRELDLRSLILLVWGMRVHLAVAFLLVTVAYWLYWFAARDAPHTPTYGRVVQFVFDGVEQGRYPNGSPFDIGDLVAPKLISSLFELHGLRDRGVSADVFANAFSIAPYAPEFEYIVNRGKQLAARATSAELVVLEERISAELRRAAAGAALLSFRALGPLPLSEGDIGKLLLELPKLWAARAIDDYGVLELDLPRPSPGLFDEQRFRDLEYLVALDAIRQNASLLLDGVVPLRQLPHANLVRDTQSTRTLVDVQQTVRDVVAQDVAQLAAHIVQRGAAKDPATLIAGYEYRVGQLQAAADLAATRVSAARRLLISLGGATTSAVAPRESAEASTHESSSASEASYMDVLVSEMLAREREAARLASDLASRRVVLTSLRVNAGDPSKADLEAVEARLAGIVAALKSQVEVVGRIHSLLAKENFGYQGKLYSMDGGGLVVTKSPVLRGGDIYIYILLVFGVMTAVLVVGNAWSRRSGG